MLYLNELCGDLLKKLQEHRYSEITQTDYDNLIKALFDNIALLRNEYTSQVYTLRFWLYRRIAKDLVFQNTGYLNDHCCIGILYGIFKMFDSYMGINSLSAENMKEWAK